MSFLIAFATGAATLSGLGFFSSPGFWCVYVLLLIILMTAFVDYFILGWLYRHLDREGLYFANGTPSIFFAIAHAPWFLFFVPYLFMAGHCAGQSKLDGPSVLVAVVAFLGSIVGGILIAGMVEGADKIINPRRYKTYSPDDIAVRTA